MGKGACTVCDHPRLADIDRELVANRSRRAIARSYSVGREALKRHVENNHLPAKLAKAQAAEEAAQADELLANLLRLQADAEALIALALGRPVDDSTITLTFADGEEGPSAGERAHIALRAIREARAGLDLRARLEEELPAPEGEVLVIYENDWRPDG